MDLLQEDENALLQQALAMSMDDSSSNVATRDTDMSEAASEDQDLALGTLRYLQAQMLALLIFCHDLIET